LFVIKASFLPNGFERDFKLEVYLLVKKQLIFGTGVEVKS